MLWKEEREGGREEDWTLHSPSLTLLTLTKGQGCLPKPKRLSPKPHAFVSVTLAGVRTDLLVPNSSLLQLSYPKT
jgi:hypothetical protein